MFYYCVHIVQLRLLASTRLHPENLGKILEHMKNLQHLDILWTDQDHDILWTGGCDVASLIQISSKLKELTIRTSSNKQCIHTFCEVSPSCWLKDWAYQDFLPQNLNIVTNVGIFVQQAIEQWLEFNSTSPADHSSSLKFYSCCKSPIDTPLILPIFQLDFGQSCTLPLVKSSNYGFVHVDQDLLSLTSCMFNGKMLHKATMVNLDRVTTDSHLNSTITDLTFVTYFDASYCESLHSDHLELLAIICPSLRELNLCNNSNCLKSLQGLRVLSSHCHYLLRLNLLGMSVRMIENCGLLWDILANLRLTCLAIESCVLPCKKDFQTVQTIITVYQNFSNLNTLELRYVNDEWSCAECYDIFDDPSGVLLVPFFPSLVHFVVTGDHYIRSALRETIISCRTLQCLVYSNNKCLSLFNAHNCNLEELCIESSKTNITDKFMSSVSAHGKLVHVVLCVKLVTGEGIATLIANSIKLTVFHVYTDYVSFVGTTFSLDMFKTTLKKKFSERKLFCCGSFDLQLAQKGYNFNWLLEDISIEHNTCLTSLWSSCSWNPF